MPGVTVEAASPALIEKIRTAVTDDQGQYKIVNLRPGTYAVTFSLPGFSSVKREGLELTSSFTATVNAELRVLVPSFEGAALRSVVERADSVGLRVQAVGSGLAREQVPAAGTMVPAGTEVVVRFAR